MTNSKLYLSLLTLILCLGACSSKKKNTFDPVGKEELKVRDDGKVDVVNTKSLEVMIDVEREKKDLAIKEAGYWKRQHDQIKGQLMQARTMLGLPAERQGCKTYPCGPDDLKPTATLSEELDWLKAQGKLKQ